MKKLFISVPMKGRTKEAIRRDIERMHKVAEVTFDQELEVISSFVEYDPPENTNNAIYCLGESVKKMAEADYFIGIQWCEIAPGCAIEFDVAKYYDIPWTLVDVDKFMPDVAEADRQLYERTNAPAILPLC